MTAVTRRSIATLATVVAIIAVSLPFIYVEVHPTVLAELTLGSDDQGNSGVHFDQSRLPLCRVDGSGVATFIFSARTDHPYGDRMVLAILPNGSADWFQQANCCQVSQGVIRGTAQLGSPQYPLTEWTDYAFRLDDAAGTPVMTGRIDAKLHRYAEGPWWATAVLGIVASVAQLITLWRVSEGRE
jgi:hypothetical protein